MVFPVHVQIVLYITSIRNEFNKVCIIGHDLKIHNNNIFC